MKMRPVAFVAGALAGLIAAPAIGSSYISTLADNVRALGGQLVSAGATSSKQFCDEKKLGLHRAAQAECEWIVEDATRRGHIVESWVANADQADAYDACVSDWATIKNKSAAGATWNNHHCPRPQ
jgi:hypothetical protein